MKKKTQIITLFSLFSLIVGCDDSDHGSTSTPKVGIDTAITQSLSLQTFDVSGLVDTATEYRLIAEVSGERFEGQGFPGADYSHVTMSRSAQTSECIAVFHNDEDGFSGVLSISPNHDLGSWWNSSVAPYKEGHQIVLCEGRVRVFLEPR